MLRFGTFNRIAEPGLHFALWPVETMEKPRVGAVRQINIGNEGTEGQMLTSDKNIINVPFSVFWRINDAKNYLFNVADQESVISAVSQSAMREVPSRISRISHSAWTHAPSTSASSSISCQKHPFSRDARGRTRHQQARLRASRENGCF